MELQSLTIPAELPEERSMNFNELRKEAIEHIQQLAGRIWTDYNIHDPGLTILEQLCLAITDLGYRIDLDMKTLLADDAQDPYRSLFPPEQILTTNPVTILDMRKLVLDVPGVRNAWVEKVIEYLPPTYYDESQRELTLKPLGRDARVRIKGLYQVVFERDDIPGLGDLQSKVLKRLHETRNLCEDFVDVRELPAENIQMQAVIEVGEVEDINELTAQVLHQVANYVSPRTHFFTLSEMLNKGYRIDEAMDGPLLDHGFIDNEKLRQHDKHIQLYASDLIKSIMDLEGVLAVQDIRISSANDEDEWVVDLDPGKAPRLDAIGTIPRLAFVRDNLPAVVDPDIVFKKFRALQDRERYPLLHAKDRSVFVSRESQLDLASYDSIQNQFPQIYGIGDLGLPSDASPQREAQALQLKGYLVFFEQVLANYFEQVAHIKDLFSFWNEDQRTYYFQNLVDRVPDLKRILLNQENYQQTLQEVTEDPETALDRKNRFINHMMARFSEQFTDYALLLYGVIKDEDSNDNSTVETANSKLIKDKLAFLRDYPALSSGRGKSFDYYAETWDTDNVAGLKKRIGRMAGIPAFTRSTLADGDQEGFHLVEHLLLRPRTDDALFKEHFLIFTWPIHGVSRGSDENHIRIESPDHSVAEGEVVEIIETNSYNGSYQVAAVHDTAFEVKATYTGDETGMWTRFRFKQDPFSLQLSFVFPGWIGRFANPTFRQFIEKIIRRETPAHLTVYTLWMGKDAFGKFETAYREFLNQLKAL